jgi:Outer membrane protein beta-barrel domain
MRQKFLLSVLASVFTVAAFAQSENGAALKPSFGVKGGVNISNLYVDDVSDENSKFGFQAGFYAKAPITSMFAIQPELIYSQKGAQLAYDNLFAKGKASFNLHYVELPVMAVVNLGKNFNIHAGPYVSYLAGVTVKNKTNDGDTNFEDEISLDNFEKFNYGVAGGIGIEGKVVGLGLRYNYGLREIGKEKTVFGQPYRVSNAKNSVLQLFVTVGF